MRVNEISFFDFLMRSNPMKRMKVNGNRSKENEKVGFKFTLGGIYANKTDKNNMVEVTKNLSNSELSFE